MIKAFKQWRCNRVGHTYGEGISCPFTGSTYIYCNRCMSRKVTSTETGNVQHG